MAEELKPNYVRFELRSVEDRTATIEQGHYVGKDVIYAIVTPAGTRDRVENEAEAWLRNVEEGVKQERIPAGWLTYYRQAYEDFKQSRETPEQGTPIIDWPGASPAQIKTLLDINVRTVEQLAAANEETLQRIGMGGRALKQKAIIWLESSNDQGKVAEEIAKLRVENEELKARDAEREIRLQTLERNLEALTPKPIEQAREDA
jgi:hypothetical protein